ncbi:MAG TPA: antibiotic biosynthesis monooxygenase, partial [Armatimonadota bacterium]|nr:antibiotic biosynthesis monooxygenase [Armatimonadota bacterium]
MTLVHVQVKPENVQEFIEASLENAQASSNEPGNRR